MAVQLMPQEGCTMNNFFEFGCIDERADQLDVKILAIFLKRRSCLLTLVRILSRGAIG